MCSIYHVSEVYINLPRGKISFELAGLYNAYSPILKYSFCIVQNGDLT